MIWDAAEPLPLLLSDATSFFVYGPSGLPIEQVSGETVQYLHHDQQGSTRIVTNASGEVAGTTTFDAYGNKLGSTGSASSPLGYDAQYTSADTGLIYLRARTYDPATSQFLTVDPLEPLTKAPYNYAGDDPANRADSSGLIEEAELPCVWPFCGPPPSAVEGLKEFGEEVVEGAEISRHGVEAVWNKATGANDEASETAGERCPESALEEPSRNAA
jgi:RHS repeat-associated protein